MMRTWLLMIMAFSFCSMNASENNNADLIIGKWITAERNSLIVEVYKAGDEYKARIIWFNDRDDKSRPMDTRCDIKNPDRHLRSRKLIGMDVLSNLKFNELDKEWQSGKIYDALSGKTWDVKAAINAAGLLYVRGYWHFPVIGKTMIFKKFILQ
jgi:uncharacterized protein (DUF2147 family)